MVEQSPVLEFEDIRAANKRIILKRILKYELNSCNFEYMPVASSYVPGIWPSGYVIYCVAEQL